MEKTHFLVKLLVKFLSLFNLRIDNGAPDNDVVVKQRKGNEEKEADTLFHKATLSGLQSEDDINDICSTLDVDFNDSQRSLISNSSTNICTIAGAGSGKSTTLVARIIYLHLFRGVKLEEITVFSFTRASVAKFRIDLIAGLSKFGVEISKEKAESVVRTFHSKIIALSKPLRESQSSQIFDLIDQKKGANIKDVNNVILNMNDKGLGEKQRDHVKTCYQNTYKENPQFAKLIDELYRKALLREEEETGSTKREKFVVEKASKRDFVLTQKMDAFFKMDGVEAIRQPIQLKPGFTHLQFYSNRYIEEDDLHLIFTPSSADIKKKIDEAYLSNHVYDKRLILTAISTSKILFVNTQLQADKITECIRRYDRDTTGASKEGNDAPLFEFAPKGEKDVVIYQSFYMMAQFMESSGVEIADLKKVNLGRADLSLPDALFLKALIIFWEAFSTYLSKRDMTRFHELFYSLSESQDHNYAFLSPALLKTMQHTMIDEFQDISPEMVSWLRAHLKALKKIKIETSLTCVGDDWQSIYGWRGSSPNFINNYAKHFPSVSPKIIKMVENYRSYQEIVDSGESILRHLQYFDPSRKGECQKTGDLADVGLTKHETDQYNDDGLTQIVDKIVELYHRYEIEGPLKKEDRFVLVLSKANETLDKIEALTKERLGKKHILKNILDFQTYHRSKGLESIYSVLVGDSVYNNHNPIRNLTYRISEHLSGNYDESQMDEAYRLAYVAITRAKKRAWWFGKAQDGGAMNLVRETKKQPSLPTAISGQEA